MTRPTRPIKVRNSPLFDRVIENTLAYIEESRAAKQSSRVTVSFIEQVENRESRSG